MFLHIPVANVFQCFSIQMLVWVSCYRLDKKICVCPSLTQAVSITDAKSLRHNIRHFQFLKLSLEASFINLMGYKNTGQKLMLYFCEVILKLLTFWSLFLTKLCQKDETFWFAISAEAVIRLLKKFGVLVAFVRIKYVWIAKANEKSVQGAKFRNRLIIARWSKISNILSFDFLGAIIIMFASKKNWFSRVSSNCNFRNFFHPLGNEPKIYLRLQISKNCNTSINIQE